MDIPDDVDITLVGGQALCFHFHVEIYIAMLLIA